MMMVIPTLFGLEGIVADELRWKGFQGVVAENGRVFFDGDFHDVAKANIPSALRGACPDCPESLPRREL